MSTANLSYKKAYTDDLAVMTAARAAVAFHITDDIKQQASTRLHAWFGPSDQTTTPPAA